MRLSAPRHGISECTSDDGRTAPGLAIRLRPGAPGQAGTLVQTMLLSLNSAGMAFVPVAVAEKPRLWLEPGPM
jgi:hypothetical protein